MLAIKHILFPVDFSERTLETAPFVAEMAKRFGADVTLISVLQPFWEPAGGMLAPVALPPPDLAQMEAGLEARLGGALTSELAGIVVHRKAQLGDPAQTITQFAQSEGVDLIMMPTHGYGPFRALLLGSVASKVLHDATCPVWTAAHTKDYAKGVPVECRTILCGVDGTPKSVPVMEWAMKFAKIAGAKLRLVHATPDAKAWPERQMNHEFEEFLNQKAREAIEQQMRASNIRAPLCVTSGGIAESIREEALRHNADLVVIGRGLLDETMGRLRTHSYGIIRSSPCPVLSV